MNITQLYLESIASLKAHRLRTILSMLGVVIGVMSVTLMIALGTSIQTVVNKQLTMLGKNILLVSTNTENANQRAASAALPELTISDIESLRVLPSVLGVAPVVQTNSIVSNAGSDVKSSVLGSDETMLSLRGWTLSSGSGITSEDVKSNSRVAIIGQSIKDSLFFLQDPIYKYVRIDGVPFQIIGVLGTTGKSFDGTNLGTMMIVPHTAASIYLLNSPKTEVIHYGVLQARSSEQTKATGEKILSLLRESHGKSKFGEDLYQITDLASVSKGASLIVSALAFMLGAVSIVSLGVGGIGIMNIMLVSVTERTREIGIRLAIGAKRKNILSQFLFESVIICLIGAAIGIIFSIGIASIISNLSSYTLTIEFSAIAVSVGFATSVGLFFGFFPAQKAARLMPAESLRS